MGSNIRKMSEPKDIPLDSGDVIEGLAKKLYNIEFINELWNSVYPVEVEIIDFDNLKVVMSDGTEFILSCKKGD